MTGCVALVCTGEAEAETEAEDAKSSSIELSVRLPPCEVKLVFAEGATGVVSTAALSGVCFDGVVFVLLVLSCESCSFASGFVSAASGVAVGMLLLLLLLLL